MAWVRLWTRMQGRWARHANRRFLEGVHQLRTAERRIPRFGEVDEFLTSVSGFRLQGTSREPTPIEYFECLADRALPTPVSVRNLNNLDAVTTDAFSGIAGRVPMHTAAVYTDALARMGQCAAMVVEILADMEDLAERDRRLRLRRCSRPWS